MARSKCCTVFGSGCDGAVPCAGLIDVDGILYGTTAYGGDVTYRSGLGTVFRISTTGKEQVLHNFGVSDGEHTAAASIHENKMLYGTTNEGGTYGEGTVFNIGAKRGGAGVA
ncbi:MAG: choice-of-anchor tandem repeat GloVer-containing protein [Candidatus Cybelea sp.]